MERRKQGAEWGRRNKRGEWGEYLMLAHWETNCVTCVVVAFAVSCVNPCWPIKPLVIYKDNDKVSPATHVHVPNDVPVYTNTHTPLTHRNKDTAGKTEIKLNTLKNASQIYKSPFGQKDEEEEEEGSKRRRDRLTPPQDHNKKVNGKRVSMWEMS